ncbi:hypothetical protein DV733_08710 [Halapricum salinum]|uniref:Uncharacterized protein n=1 Tax=Halapricum salinum TaxID=1457250 RepID=A0A4D6HDT2_9EURY|nr:hypothetical protein DV733_08710 [Halapricum salinum]
MATVRESSLVVDPNPTTEGRSGRMTWSDCSRRAQTGDVARIVGRASALPGVALADSLVRRTTKHH